MFIRLCPSLWGWWSPVDFCMQTTSWAFQYVPRPCSSHVFPLSIFLQKTIGKILASMEIFSRFETILEVSKFVSAQEAAVQNLLLTWGEFWIAFKYISVVWLSFWMFYSVSFFIFLFYLSKCNGKDWRFHIYRGSGTSSKGTGLFPIFLPTSPSPCPWRVVPKARSVLDHSFVSVCVLVCLKHAGSISPGLPCSYLLALPPVASWSQLCFCGTYTSVISHTWPWCPVASCRFCSAFSVLFNVSSLFLLDSSQQPMLDPWWNFLLCLQNCGLPAILDGPGPFTVFVPSNDGVDKLRDGRLIYLFTEVRAHTTERHPELTELHWAVLEWLCAMYLVVAESYSSWGWLNHIFVSVRLWERSGCWWNVQWEIWSTRLLKSGVWLSFLTPALGRGKWRNLTTKWIVCYRHWHLSVTD